MFSPKSRQIPRRILALFLPDFESMKTFEELQQGTLEIIPRELQDAFLSAELADSKATQALAALERMAQALELIASAPGQTPLEASELEAALLDFVLPQADADPPPYGSAYSNTPTTTTISVAGTPTEVTSGLSQGLVHLMSFGGNHYLQMQRGGIYEINWSISMSTTSANDKLEGGLMINAVAQTPGLAHGDTANANSDIEVSGSALLKMAALDQLSIYVMNHSAARNITLDHVTLVVKLIDRRVP